MSKYFYIARNKSGVKVNGVEDASSEEEVVNRLQSRDLVVISLISETKGDTAGMTQKQEGGKKAGFRIQRHSGVNSNDLVLFCRQLATLLGAGVTILKSLDIISLQVSSRRLYTVVKNLERDMEGGASFHQAMAKHPKVFSDLWINLVESGEASGNLAVVLARLAGYMERSAAFKTKIISAVIYPAILFVVAMGALVFLTVKIIPTFAELFKGFNITLPLLTRILIKISELMRHYFFIIIIGIVVGVILFRKYIATKPGRRSFENLLFHLPVFGEFFRVLVVERFTSEMSTLVESGVPILYSLEIAERSVGNLTLGEVIHKIKEGVRDGKNLSQPLEESGFFDPMAVQMVTIGEEIGELSAMFKRLNDFYTQYADTFLTRFASMFEPIMLVVIGAIVGVIVVGMFLPVFQIAQIS
ncbi:MAG: type II secretion system F family protein [Candidatus Omnitrophota bacterium]